LIERKRTNDAVATTTSTKTVRMNNDAQLGSFNLAPGAVPLARSLARSIVAVVCLFNLSALLLLLFHTCVWLAL
jgi:hypothetical protein